VPGDPQEYARAARWLVGRWPSEIAALQVWNEPNLPEFFADPDPAVYTRLLAAAYSQVKGMRPDVTVVTLHPPDSTWIGAAASWAGLQPHRSTRSVRIPIPPSVT
jgi:hypothetical protein